MLVTVRGDVFGAFYYDKVDEIVKCNSSSKIIDEILDNFNNNGIPTAVVLGGMTTQHATLYKTVESVGELEIFGQVYILNYLITNGYNNLDIGFEFS